jgi:hypothetical protein
MREDSQTNQIFASTSLQTRQRRVALVVGEFRLFNGRQRAIHCTLRPPDDRTPPSGEPAFREECRRFSK